MSAGHPSCLDMNVELVSQIKMYPWQCMECKTCTVCEQPHHEDEMMFCDKCDRGFHTFCVGMESIPLGESLSDHNISHLIGCVWLDVVKQSLYFSCCFSYLTGCWVCDLCNKVLSTPQKKGTTKTPKKSK